MKGCHQRLVATGQVEAEHRDIATTAGVLRARKGRPAKPLAVMMAMALGHVKQGRIEQMRSLVRPIPATG